MLMKSIRLECRLSDCQNSDYTNCYDCTLARALKRVVSEDVFVVVSSCGTFMLRDDTSYFRGQANNFNYSVVSNAKRGFTRRVMIPVKYLKEESI